MNIGAVVSALATIQGGLTITSPINATCAAFAYPPRGVQGNALPAPCWINDFTLSNIERGTGIRRQHYTIHMQFFVDDADQDQAAQIATAFLAAFIDALDSKVNLSGTCTTAVLRGGDPTLVGLERGGKNYTGLNLFMDVILTEGRTFSV